MNHPNENQQSEQKQFETPNDSPKPSLREPEPTHLTVKENEQPNRISQFLCKALLWLLIIAISFLAGYLVNHFVRYQPLAMALDETQADLDQADEEIDDLTRENERLASEINSADEEITTLQEDLDAARANIKYFQILVDVNNARIHLFLEDIEAAQAALEDTQARLENLLPVIEEINPELAISLPRRLDLIVSGLERDPETGRIDLELFTKDLLELEPLLLNNGL